MESNDKLEELLRQMYAEETQVDLDEEWQKFEAKHFTPKRKSWGWMQIAALFIGVLMLSGIAYAAIHFASTRIEETKASMKQEALKTSDSQQEQTSMTDSTMTVTPVNFENTRLDTMLTDIATYYHHQVDIRNEALRDLRLFYRWDRKTSIESVIEELNNFEQLHLTLEGNTIIAQ
ncbi:MAG: DUF4974 domain-containing protein [Prevotella sp.]|nr:DUF4974 domain-containing protein [Prevotella sp.]